MSTKNNAKAAAPSAEQLMELVLKLKAENEALKASSAKSAIAISQKGGINVTVPSGRASVTMHFYAWQWAKVSAMRDEIDAFAKKNADKLTTEEAFRSREK